ncbi:biosynthetic-type acetolactate synthase large subunit [Geothermobacter hydrogeniphilus]|uniref:Acetolactate synthase n=1 Tax=Geothermobacter hydrogeniphilus TaxID=1969733 RepID=A0A1X0Y3R7_9BACT|nr:biosynthetic-type acetolactate synthase large subunit [Geothermobacter hydrogeniphilus]ORJ59779.1 acetolactate synthase, large subunit, biosynthetic type [Geothermobacter hydrogeniphilus]
MTGKELLLRALADRGVQTIFGYTGGAIMPVFDQMDKLGHFKFIMSRHEQGAAFMAQGLSRASLSTANPQVGVCMATSGPGAMNLVTGIADAYMDSVPMVAVTGQVATGVIATDAFQESDVIGVMMPICKQTYMPLFVEEIEQTVHEAFYVATTGRGGPVVLDIPKDVQNVQVDKDYHFDTAAFRPALPGFYYHPTPAREPLQKAVELINRSERPVIFCGHGVISSNAGKLLQQFAEKVNIPVAFTLHGLSAMPLDHPLSLGMMGMHGTVEANRAIMEADLLISFGMRFDDRVTGKLSEYAQNADVIHVEIDPSEIGKNVQPTVAINADVYRTLHVLVSDPMLAGKPRRRWRQRIAEAREVMAADLRREIDKGVGDDGALLMKTIIDRLSKLTGGRDLIVSDVGQHQMMAARFYNYQTPNSWFASGGAGTMGCSLPMAIGVKLARPEERVWSINGDGGFQMNMQELGTIMEQGTDLKIMILNNGYLGMVRQWQTLFFDGRYAGTPMQSPDFGQVASAYGIPYRKVTELAEIEPAIQEAIDHPGAIMLEFVCDPSEVILPMIPAGGGFDDMIIKRPKAKKKKD